MVLAGWKVVTTQNVVRAVLYLVVVLAGAAAQFILLSAEFIALVQVLVYIGAIVILFLFGTMLTRAPIGRDVELDNDQKWLAAFGAYRHNIAGQVFALFVITVAAAEVGVGLAIVVLIFRNRASIALDEVDLMKG